MTEPKRELTRAEKLARLKQLRAKPKPKPLSFPLSYAQTRFWTQDQLSEGAGFNILTYALDLQGALRFDVLRGAFDDILKRHEILRADFQAQDGEPLMRIHPGGRVNIPVIDLTSLDNTAQEAVIADLMRREEARRFDLSKRPLLALHLVRLKTDAHLLLLSIHHIISDAWSLGLLAREFQVFYNARSQNTPAPLSKLDIQFPDYVDWERKWLTPERIDGWLDYWRTRLADAPALLELPTDRPRPAVMDQAAGEVIFTVPATALGGLDTIARRAKVTRLMALLTAWQLFLARMADQDDVVVGTPVSGRNQTALEGVFGLFVNTIAVRLQLNLSLTFAELLDAARPDLVADFRHKDLPFDQLVHALQPERAAYAPVYQVMFALLDSGAAPELSGLQLTARKPERSRTVFDLNLTLFEGEDGLSGALEFSSRLFDRETVAAWATGFTELIIRLGAQSDRPLRDLPLLDETERNRLLSDLNRSERAYDRTALLHDAFTTQAARRPDHPALVFGDDVLTYAQLERRSAHLAARLQRLGAAPDVLIGLYLDRSPHMVVAMLAVLRAGAAYLPLDPAFPRRRLEAMVADSGAPLILTQSALRDHMLDVNADLLYVDDVDETGDPAQLAPVHTTAHNLAYAIYTSGSTGTPKGVQIPHQAVVNFLHSMAHKPGLTEEARFLAVTTMSFDISVLELFLPLSVGATLVLADAATSAAGDRLATALTIHQITHMQATPSTWRMMVDAGWTGRPTLTALCGGEALPADLARRLRPQIASLWNMYGPTETTIWSATAPVAGDQEGVEPIGPPIDNTQLYVLDPWLQPLPVGAPGQLFIAGEGLARNYRNRAALTADRYLPDPFTATKGARMYQTGDKVRRLRNGALAFMGRIDHQVKLRGYRIELGEIESRLVALDAIREAVVVIRDDIGDPRIVAYLTLHTAQDDIGEQAATALRRDLPEYMIPSAFVTLYALPLTPNRKIDRKALPAPSFAITDIVPPQTPAQQQIWNLFQEFLGLSDFGIHDPFFKLGGHSLLATRVSFKLGEQLGRAIPAQLLFEHPTVAAVAQWLSESNTQDQLPPITAAPLDQPAPLSDAQQRLWFMDQMNPGSGFYNVPIAVRLGGALYTPALERAFNQVVARHDVFRTTFPDEGKTPVILPHEPTRITPRDVAPEQLTSRITEESNRGFDLATGPLWRLIVWRLGEEEHILQLTMHHIITDGWSMGLLIEEWVARYNAERTGGRTGATPPTTPDALQYRDYAVWQRRHQDRDFFASLVDFWRDTLQDAPPLTTLTTDQTRPEQLRFAGKVLPFTLQAADADALRAWSRAEGTTLFMALLTGYFATLRWAAGRDDLVIGTDVANRNRPETRTMIGFFINQLVLRQQVREDVTLVDLLHQVQTQAMAAYAHQELPFDQLVEALKPKRDPSATPLFQLKLVYQEQPAAAAEPGGLELELVQIERATAQFDIVLNLNDAGTHLAGNVEFNTDLYREERIRDFLDQLTHVWRRAAAEPTLTVAQVANELDARVAAAKADAQAKTLEDDRRSLQAFKGRRRRGARSGVGKP